MSQKTKFCPQCQLEKKLVLEFWRRNRREKDGWDVWCKDCNKIYFKGLINKKKNSYDSKTNKERCKERYQRMKDDPDFKKKNAENKQKWASENPERKKESDKEYRKRTNEHRTEYNQQYRESHPGWSQEVAREYWRNNPEKGKARNHRRNALLKNAPGEFTADDLKLMYDMQGGYCKYCGAPLYGVYEPDHIIPISRGGSNKIENIAIACKPCNRSKNNKLLSEWHYFVKQP